MLHTSKASRPVAFGLAASLVIPTLLAGCGGRAPQAPQNLPGPQASNPGMSTKQKLTLIAGAAALYYVYNRYKKQNEAALKGQNVQYYLSKNGQVYYRDPKNPRNVIWVTKPEDRQRTFELPANEASQYSAFQGYNNQRSGQTLKDVFQTQ